MRGILLIGGGGHCKAAIDVIETAGLFSIAGIVERAGSEVTEVMGYPVLGDDDLLTDLLRSIPAALVTIGQIKSPAARIRAFDSARAVGVELPVIVSPRAHVSRQAQLGVGTLVMHGAVVNAGAFVGENVILNSMSLVEHGVTICNHCHISTGARVNGDVAIGEGCFIGSGAVLKNGIAIGAGSVIGAGTVVLGDVPPGSFIRHTPKGLT